MYAMCCGHPPFRSETPYGILRRITDHEARPLRELNADIPAWLEGLIGKLLQKSPDKRPSSASEVASLLKDCLAHVQQPQHVPLPNGLARSSHRRTFSVAAIALTTLAAIVLSMQPSLWKKHSKAPELQPAPNGDVAQSSHHAPSDEPHSSRPVEPTNHQSDHSPTAPLVMRGDAGDVDDGHSEADLRWDTSSDFAALEQNLTDLRLEFTNMEGSPNE